jgi:predicted AAA+ superfamily ATPase
MASVGPVPAISPQIPRLATQVLADNIASFPAVMIGGARAVGKTTTAANFAASFVSLDEPSVREPFLANPDVVLKTYEEPVLLDEWQLVPELLGAVKRAVDADSSPGRFILAGSAAPKPGSTQWAGTGRIVNMQMYPLTQSEIHSLDQSDLEHRRTFLNSILDGRLDDVNVDYLSTKSIDDYVQDILTSGFPFLNSREFDDHARADWLESYLRSVTQRDILDVNARVQPASFERYVHAYLAVAGTYASEQTLLDAASISRATATTYRDLLRRLYFTQDVLPFESNEIARITKSPKHMVLDASFLGSRAVDFLQNGNLLGRALEVFVHMQLVPISHLRPNRFRIYQLRKQNTGAEIDFVLETSTGGVVAIEVKANATSHQKDARHLVRLRDQLGERFIAGLVLNTSRGVKQLDHQIYAAPISCLWN